MVKIPQGKVGYAVNGEIVLLPNRSLGFQHKRKIRRDHRKGAVRGLRNKLKHFANELEDLKNFSKIGSVGGAYGVTSKIANAYYVEANSESAFQLVARSFVFPDADHRSALYYAAHSGRAHLVRIYLAICILSRSLRCHKMKEVTTEKSFYEWFQTLGSIDCFDLEEFNICYLNSLNEKVKLVLKSERYSLQSLKKIVTQTPWSQTIPKVTKPSFDSKSKRKPKLEFDELFFACQEDYDLYCVQPYYYDDPDEYFGVDDDNFCDAFYLNIEDQSTLPESPKASSVAVIDSLTCNPGSKIQDVSTQKTIVVCLERDEERDISNRNDLINTIWSSDIDDWSLVSDRSSSSDDVLSFVNVDFI